MYVGRDRVPAERARRGKAEDTGAGAKIKDIAVARARASEPVEHSEASGRGRMLPGAECASGIDQKGNAACGGRAGMRAGVDMEPAFGDRFKTRLRQRYPILFGNRLNQIGRASCRERVCQYV